MIKSSYEPAQRQLEAYLKEHKLKRTNERMQILEQVCSYSKPFTATQLHADMNLSLKISIATIYNTLRIFQGANLITLSRRQKEVESIVKGVYNKSTDRHVYYQIAQGTRSTMMFVCSRCGKEKEFKNKILENSIEAQHFSNYIQQRFSLVIYGTCKKCRRLIAKSL